MTYLIAPSILSADMTRLGEEVEAVLNAGADLIHFDVMDNHYVPNLTFGPPVCAALHKRFPNAVLDVHLMATPVDDLIVQFAKAGAKRISIHPDASIHLDRSLDLIQQQQCKAGLVLNPSTSPECLNWCHYRLDFVLVMTVNPGFGGQKLIPEVKEKISWIKEHFPHLPICIDGGVGIDNIANLAKTGASQFVAGSAIFSSQDYRQTILEMRAQLKAVEA
ncbi:ribulose-phosphate 3-epimerase [Legionella jordanis]|uniref:Ribulose-phosphate 3-epimerase n=1 Tax=Legionella jordanis TaxID=456 RepID=A0A0W0VFS1_9GAMM|nr:ribulose-phosphate 3-epimerase [Legionella jordanis]KTD19006.1 D-ribulose-5-phosphate-3-epimerase [Legionella jordanis]RMX05433.1 ribulose-phosphate 3-epimerase [Legionella jordanis]VEH13108.1 D-ribulose-5-phosphate-3-epimerase [Legionella jordanis]